MRDYLDDGRVAGIFTSAICWPRSWADIDLESPISQWMQPRADALAGSNRRRCGSSNE